MSDSYAERADAIENKISAAIKGTYKNDKEKFVDALKRAVLENVVIYSAYETDQNDLPIDNLDKIPHKGTFVVISTMHWGDKNYESDPVTDPTWLELTVLANEAIHVTGDDHHVFFENVTKKGNILELSFGS